MVLEGALLQAVSLTGAAMVLYAYVAGGVKWMNRDGAVYLFLNWFGTMLLAWTAMNPFNIGLFLVEAVWSVVSAFLLIRLGLGTLRTKKS